MKRKQKRMKKRNKIPRKGSPSCALNNAKLSPTKTENIIGLVWGDPQPGARDLLGHDMGAWRKGNPPENAPSGRSGPHPKELLIWSVPAWSVT